MADSEKQWESRLRSGDRDALGELYRRYVDRVWRYGFLRCGSREAAAEIVQETFLRVIRSIHGFEGRSSIGTWLFAVARSATTEYLRKRTRRERRPDHPTFRIVAEDSAGPDSGASEEESEALREAIRLLPPAQKHAIVLYELSGLSIKDVGETLGWSQSRVKTTLFRARRRLRESLGLRLDDVQVRTFEA